MNTQADPDTLRSEPAQAESAEEVVQPRPQRGPMLDVEDAVERPAQASPSTGARSDQGPVVQREEFEALSNAVLEAAEIASQAALAASTAGREFKNTTGVLSDLTLGLNKRSIWALGILSGLLVLSFGFFAVMAIRLVSKTNQLDATVMAVGKRVVELDAGLTGLRAIQENMDALTERVTTLSKAQAELGQRVDSSVQQSAVLVQQVPEKTARQVADTSSNLVKQVQALNSRLQSQASAVRSMGDEMKALQGSVGEMASVKRDVEALVTLQRERYLEALQKQGQVAVDANALRFPRQQPPRTAAPSAGPVVNPVNPAAPSGGSGTPR